jgi:subtilase family serine protease
MAARDDTRPRLLVSVRGLGCVLAMLAGLAGCGGTRVSHAGASSRAADAGSGCLTHSRTPLCYAPSQFRAAYGLQLLLSEGIDGRGSTVVLLEPAVAHPTVGATVIQQDLAHYESRFGIPVAGLEVVSANPSSPSSALATPEELLDVEMVHTIAPGAGIRILPVRASEASRGAAVQTIVRALNEAVRQNLGDVISLSLGVSERCVASAQLDSLHSALRAARDRDITVIAASGDFGAATQPCSAFPSRPAKAVELPAADPLVTAVGGTHLLADPRTGRYIGETAWNTPPGQPGAVNAFSSASGGGFSTAFPRPTYQAGEIGTADKRGVPDVAGDADPATGLALLAYVHGRNTIVSAGGTSAAAPFWAGLIALADQVAGRKLGFVNPALYRIARGPHYHAAFHDITRGDNSVAFSSLSRIRGYRASTGWDPVTGWGSPNAQVLVPLLAKQVRPGDGRGL